MNRYNVICTYLVLYLFVAFGFFIGLGKIAPTSTGEIIDKFMYPIYFGIHYGISFIMYVGLIPFIASIIYIYKS